MYTHTTIHVYSYKNVNPYSYNLASKACFEIRRDIFIDFEFVVVSTSTLSVIVFRLKSRESQKYIDLGLEKKSELAACMHIVGCTLQS